jgi:hypothetical protein
MNKDSKMVLDVPVPNTDPIHVEALQLKLQYEDDANKNTVLTVVCPVDPITSKFKVGVPLTMGSHITIPSKEMFFSSFVHPYPFDKNLDHCLFDILEIVKTGQQYVGLFWQDPDIQTDCDYQILKMELNENGETAYIYYNSGYSEAEVPLNEVCVYDFETEKITSPYTL